MDYVQKGFADLPVSRIGFGCAPIGGYDYGEVDDKESISAIESALNIGINFFDTADVYGFGHSEEILGKALGSQRNEVIIASKFGLKWDQQGRVTRDCSAKHVFEAIDNSLRRLGIDAITLYQIHWPDPDTPIQETIEALLSCQKAGKIRYIGCSNFGKDLIEDFQKLVRIEALQASYNLLDRGVEKGILSYCKHRRMAFFAHSPLARGFLTGKYNEGHVFSGTDTRQNSYYFSDENVSRNQELLCTLREIASKYGKTMSQVSIRWILDNPRVTSAIVGIKDTSQIESCAGALDWKLSPEDFNIVSRQRGALVR